MEYYFIIALSGWLCVELILFLLFKWLRSDFQWLIMGADKTPVLNKKALENGYCSVDRSGC
mgnify:CR=1 FL=1